MKEWTLKLPCHLGDTVYGISMIGCAIDSVDEIEAKQKIAETCRDRHGECEGCEYLLPKIEKFVCTSIEIDNDGIWICGAKMETYRAEDITTDKAEIEARLKEMKEKIVEE